MGERQVREHQVYVGELCELGGVNKEVRMGLGRSAL